jgi:PAS domain S-box-containing protein
MQQLIKTGEFYDTIDLIITPIILANNDTVCQYVNKAFLSQIGYNIEDIRDQETWFNKAHPDETYRREVKENWQGRLESAKNKGETHVHMITKIRCANGSSKWFDVHESIYGNSKVVTFLDVDDLQESNEELTDVLKQKDILLSIIAHDVRSPLGNIKQIVNNYKNMDLSEKETEELFSGMGIQIDYIFNIINSLLVRTSADRGSFIEKREHTHLKGFFIKYREYYKERMEKQKVDFVFDLPEDASLYFDPFILDVICRNLIDNAIKYSPKNGNIYISFAKKGDHADLVIRDTGPGMSETQIERILNNQGSRRLKSQITDSFGLGLVMAKEILEKHDGKLGIESEIGKGTSFVISILNK